jgi:hypothetical protein
MMKDEKKYNNLFEMVLHKIVILIGIGAALLIIVSAIAPHVLGEDVNIDGYPICEEKMNVIDVPCVMITVPINCTAKTVTIYDYQNTTIIDSMSMADYRELQYYFNLSLPTGRYILNACNGLITRDVFLENKCYIKNDFDHGMVWYNIGMVFISLIFIMANIFKPMEDEE